MPPAGPAATCPSPEAEAFVRFCYQRRRVGWPELYDEMCAVATRGLFRGMCREDLAEVGVGFSLFETPRLAALVIRIAAEEQAARRAARATVIAAATERGAIEPSEAPSTHEPATHEPAGAGVPVMAAAPTRGEEGEPVERAAFPLAIGLAGVA